MANLDFVALDFETATSERNSICEVGLATVRNGAVVRHDSWLVRPPGNTYAARNIAVHGITPNDTAASPTFAELWPQLRPLFDNQLLVAHNTTFDMYCLESTFREQKIALPRFRYLDSLRLARWAFPGLENYKLDTLCNAFHIHPGHHHRAGDDAKACAELFLRILNHYGEATFDDLAKRLDIVIGKFSPRGHRPQRIK